MSQPVAPPDPMTLGDLVDLARRKAVELADPALKVLRDEASWDALATVVDELVAVSLYQQRLIEEALGVPSAGPQRWSALVEQARSAR